MKWGWLLLTAISLASIGWHEISDHQIIERLTRPGTPPTAHHQMWDSIGRSQRRAIRTEMACLAGLAAAFAALFPVIALPVIGIVVVVAARWSLFASHD